MILSLPRVFCFLKSFISPVKQPLQLEPTHLHIFRKLKNVLKDLKHFQKSKIYILKWFDVSV